jgi:hypothetical protein
MAPADETYVYHPLGPYSVPYAAYLDWSQGAASRSRPDATLATAREAVLRRYRPLLEHANGQRDGEARASIPDTLSEDGRPLVRTFQAFFPAFLEKTDLPPAFAGTPLCFPQADIFDARCLTHRGEAAIVVTSRTLDIIEFFANAMSLCVRLNGQALPGLLSLGPASEPLALAWIAVTSDVMQGTTLDDVLQRACAGNIEQALREELFVRRLPAAGSEARRAAGQHFTAHYIGQLTMRALNRLVRHGGADGEACLKIVQPLPSGGDNGTIDAQFLALLILTFIVLHEIGHQLLRHNDDPEPSVVEAEIAEGAMRHVEGDPQVQAFNLLGSTLSFELAADNFALEVVTDEEFRQVLLEAASLWCAVLESNHERGTDWIRSSFDKPQSEHPAYPMRVWYLNGRFSSGKRQGEIAQTIRRHAEAVGKQVRSRAALDEHALQVFRALWTIGMQEIAAADA